MPVDEQGGFLPLTIDGEPAPAGRCSTPSSGVVVRSLDRTPSAADATCDLCWYLWCGPRSPLFGKDQIATFENDLVADDGDARTRRRTRTSS